MTTLVLLSLLYSLCNLLRQQSSGSALARGAEIYPHTPICWGHYPRDRSRGPKKVAPLSHAPHDTVRQHVLGMPDVLRPEIAQGFPWIVGLFPVALLSGVGVGALESREHFLLANVLQVSGMSLGQIVLAVFADLVSLSLAIVVPAAAVVVVVRALTVAAILIAVYRDEGPLSLAAFDRHQVAKLLKYGGWISVSAVIGPILTSLG
jgi:hypothetical protein